MSFTRLSAKRVTVQGLLGRRNHSLFELVVVVILISLMAGLMLYRYVRLQVDVERTAMARDLGAIRSAVALRFLHFVMRGDMQGAAAMAGTNPIQYLASPPDTYLGSFDNPRSASIAGGHWYFDSGRRLLVYRVAHGRYFHTGLPGPPRAAFRIQVRYDDVNHDGTFEPGSDGFKGVNLAPLRAYHWLGAGKLKR